MRKYFKYNPNVKDIRCQVCKQHEYIVIDERDDDWSWIHTHIDKPLTSMTQTMMIHFWHPMSLDRNRKPPCIQSFKEVKF